MRRRGLFRGKALGPDDKPTNQWVYGHLYEDKTGSYIKKSDKAGRFGCGYPVDPATVGEFSGETLRGRDLYEDDLIKMDNVEPDMMWIRFIEGAFCLCAVEQIKGPDHFNGGKERVSFEKGEYVMDIHYIHHAGREQAEIVGTIHDEVKT